jgi:hypothetical protein
MRKFFVPLFCLSLLFASSLSVRAQGQAEAILYPADISNFPTISAFLDVYDASNAFVSGLKPEALTAFEDGKPLPITAVNELTIPAQIVVAVNPGPQFDLRDATGVSRFQWITQALTTWAQARPADTQDDLSLVTLAGPIILHADVKDWLVSLNSFQPNFKSSTPNLQTLSIALDAAIAQGTRSGVKRAILFITPHMEDPNVDSELQPLIQRAIQNRIHVFVWMADLDAVQATTSAAAFSQLAQATGGVFYFSSSKTFTDPEAYFAPLRKLYSIKYTSAVSSGGQHTLSVQVKGSSGIITSANQTFSVDIQPPNPILVSPPLQITRQPPADDPYNAQVFEPATQEIDIIVEFPDGHTRPLTQTTLYVDGQVAAQNTKPPFNKFVWDLSNFTISGSHTIAVEAVDGMGLKKTSMEIPVTITVVQPPHGITAIFGKYRQYITYGAIGFAGAALLLILLITRLQVVFAKARQARRINADPLTQPIAAVVESDTKESKPKTRPRNGRGKTNQSPASLIRLNSHLEPASANPIPLTENEITFGADTAQSTHILNDASIAPRHARITQSDDGVFHIRDEGSVAGTWVNYDQVGKDGHILQHGDVIHFGQLIYRFQLKNPPSLPEPTIKREKDAT